jgi:hypothetical protein
MKSKITLNIDADLLRQAKIMAAQEDTSISAPVSRELENLVQRRTTYDRARKRALARLRAGANLEWTPPIPRDELHERQIVHRLPFGRLFLKSGSGCQSALTATNIWAEHLLN